MKRGRDGGPPDVEEALHTLIGTLERAHEYKLRALDKVISVVDPNDDLYVAQRALVDGDAAFYITELLADARVGPKAAEAVTAVCRHAGPSMARLATGAFDSSVGRVSLNPCQSDFIDSGAVAALVPMVLQRSEAAREAGADALAALCSFNQEGKLAYLEGLVQALTQKRQLEALELLDALIDGMECGGEAAARQLDLIQESLLAEVRAGRGRLSGQSAVSLLGTLCERRPELAAELREAGAVAGVAQHLLHGSQEVQDVAARSLWLLVKDNKKCWADGGLLGCDAAALARVLVQLIEAADAEEAQQREEEDGAAGSGWEEDGPGGSGSGGLGGPAAAAADICHADEASELLKALSAAHPQVEQLVEEREVPVARRSSQNCCIQ